MPYRIRSTIYYHSIYIEQHSLRNIIHCHTVYMDRIIKHYRLSSTRIGLATVTHALVQSQQLKHTSCCGLHSAALVRNWSARYNSSADLEPPLYTFPPSYTQLRFSKLLPCMPLWRSPRMLLHMGIHEGSLENPDLCVCWREYKGRGSRSADKSFFAKHLHTNVAECIVIA